MQSSFAQTLHPFVLADVQVISRSKRHTDLSWAAIEYLRSLIAAGVQCGMLFPIDPRSCVERYEVSRNDVIDLRIRAARATRRSIALSSNKEQRHTDHLVKSLNRLIYLGIITARPLPQCGPIFSDPPKAYPLTLSRWIEISHDYKGYSVGPPLSSWPQGFPNCFDVEIPESGGVPGRTALAAVNITNNLYRTTPAPTYSAYTRALLDDPHHYDHRTNELLYISGLDPDRPDHLLIRGGDRTVVSIASSELAQRTQCQQQPA